MADHTPPPSSDPDFPVDPHEAAKLQAQLQQAATNLHDELWDAMKELLHTADLLYI